MCAEARSYVHVCPTFQREAAPRQLSWEAVASMFPPEKDSDVPINSVFMRVVRTLSYHGQLLRDKHPVAMAIHFTRQHVRR